MSWKKQQQTNKTKQKKSKKLHLTFFFCTCSFSEALEGLRLSIFPFSGPQISLESLERMPWGRHTALDQRFFRHDQSSQITQERSNWQEGRAALDCSQTECRCWEEVTWHMRNRGGKPSFLVLGLHTRAEGFVIFQVFSNYEVPDKLYWHTHTHKTVLKTSPKLTWRYSWCAHKGSQLWSNVWRLIIHTL